MGKLKYYMTEKGPTFVEPSEEYGFISYEECIDFLSHLKERGSHIEERKVKGLFNSFDMTNNDVQLLKIIKESDGAEDAYRKACKHMQTKRQNCNHKLMPELENIYREDLYEYLLDNGINNAEKISDLISKGEYKEYRKHNPQILSASFDLWAKASNYLPSRNDFKRRFQIENLLYIHRKEYSKIIDNIKQITLWCENLQGFKIEKEDILDVRLSDLFDKYSPSSIVIHLAPVEIRYQILQIRISNRDVEGESGLQDDLYKRLSTWNDVTSIEIDYEDGSNRELIVKWADELFNDVHGESDFYQRHIPEIENGVFTDVFTSSYVIDYWAKEDTKSEENQTIEKEGEEKSFEIAFDKKKFDELMNRIIRFR